jgi:O-antigen/teichoic acid export membrane protein
MSSTGPDPEARHERVAEPAAIAPDSITRNTAFSLAAQATGASLTAVLTLFLVRALGPRDYGLLALSISISAIVLIAADFGVSSSTSRFAAERRDRRDEVGALYVDALKLKVAATGTVCLLLALLAGPIATAFGEPELEWPLRGIAVATLGQSIFLMGLANALGQSTMRLKVTTFESVTEVSASVALVLLGGGAAGAAFGRAIGYLAGALLAVVLTLRLLGYPRLRPTRPPSREAVRRVARYASALVVVDTAFILSVNANTLLVGAYLGSAASGILQAPGRLIVLFQYLGLSVANGVAPRMARRPGHAPEVSSFNTALRLLIAYQCALLAPVVLWSQPLVDLLLGDGYERAGDVLRALAPYMLFSGVAPLLSMSVNYLGEARRRIPIAVTTLVLTIISATTLIPLYGIVGAAIATNISYGFYALGHFWLCRRLLSLPLAPLVWSLARALVAASAMGLLLSRFGTTALTIPELLAGGAAGLVVYVGVLVLTREVTAADVAWIKGRGRRRRRPPLASEHVAEPGDVAAGQSDGGRGGRERLTPPSA